MKRPHRHIAGAGRVTNVERISEQGACDIRLDEFSFQALEAVMFEGARIDIGGARLSVESERPARPGTGFLRHRPRHLLNAAPLGSKGRPFCFMATSS